MQYLCTQNGFIILIAAVFELGLLRATLTVRSVGTKAGLEKLVRSSPQVLQYLILGIRLFVEVLVHQGYHVIQAFVQLHLQVPKTP